MSFWDWIGKTAGSAISEPVKAIGDAADELLTSDHELSIEETKRLGERVKASLADIAMWTTMARHPSWWVAGARGAPLWAAAAMGVYCTAGQHFLTWLAMIGGWPVPPYLDIQETMLAITPLCGVGGYYVHKRTEEKRDGVAR